ncbi:hypothetical protein CCASP_02300 [Corynebacterium caspium DSM 44850]|nr:hypothetical protein CCASP_02300 [Corynebacterium caspium DSM 44850]
MAGRFGNSEATLPNSQPLITSASYTALRVLVNFKAPIAENTARVFH